MAIIGKIRKRSTLLLIFVGVALLSFIVGNNFMKNIGQGKDYDPQTIAKINNEKVERSIFQARMEQTIEGFKQQQGKENVTNEENYQIMSQVWDQLKKENIIDQECIKIGLLMDNGVDPKPSISMKEFADLMQGTYPHQLILQNFTDQQTGKFDPNSVMNFLNSVQQGKKSTNEEERDRALKSETQWNNLVNYIKKDRVVEKYNILLSKSYYLPKALAEVDYKEKNTNLSIRFFGIRYNTISDSAVKVTDADYQAYYDQHKNEFEVKEESRSIDYVVWNVKPSAEDIQAIESEVAEIKTEFGSVNNENVAQFISRNSDSRFDTNWTAKGKLPVYIDSLAFSSPVGTIFGPWMEKESYHLARIMDMQARPDSMKASHILISYAGAAKAAQEVTRTKIQSKAIADSLLKVIKTNPAAFDEFAGTISDDAAAKTKNGDLDWFADGAMIPEFNEACIKGKVGDIVIVETVFGNHILKITGKKEPVRKVKVAIVDKKLAFSNNTYNKAYNEASKFVSTTTDSTSFDKNTTDKGIQVMHSGDLKLMDAGIQGLNGSRNAIQWAFREDTEIGKISDLFPYDDKIVVAILLKVKEKGISPLEDVKDFIKPLVIRDVKAKMMLEKYKNAGNDINAIAAKNNVMVDTFPNYTFGNYSLPTYGPEPSFQGRIYAMEKNKLYGPIKGDQGVYFVIVDSKTEAPKTNDNYMMTRSQAQMMFSQRITNYMDKYGEPYKALEDKAEIKDFRYFFY